LASCTTSSPEQPKDTLALVLADSIVVHSVGKVELVGARQGGQRLLFFNNSTQTVMEVDRQGKVQASFARSGGGPEEWGRYADNVGYYGDTAIVIASTSGYQFYTLTGKFIRRVGEKNEFGNGGMWKRIRALRHKDRETLFSVFRLPVPKDMVLDYRSRRHHEQFKPITMFDVASATHQNMFGYAPQSIFLKFDYYYNTKEMSFDYDYGDSTFYMLYDPEPTIYAYPASQDFALGQAIDLKPEHFKVPLKAKFDGREVDIFKSLAVNSDLSSLNVCKNHIFVTYSTGIPEDEYTSPGDMANIAPVLEKHYLIVVKDGQKISADIQMPKGLYSLALANSPDDLISAIPMERGGQSIFHVYKLVQ
jgi:hypothetical protein